jgi:hypothetical protein
VREARDMRGSRCGTGRPTEQAIRLPGFPAEGRPPQIPEEGTLDTWLGSRYCHNLQFTEMQTLTVEISQTRAAESAPLTTNSSGRPCQKLAGALRAVQSVNADLNHGYCCWQDVVDAIEAAKACDQAKADKSFIRARLRKSAAELGVLESLTNMIPDQDGLSILRGGMMTVLKVCFSQFHAPISGDETHSNPRWCTFGSRSEKQYSGHSRTFPKFSSRLLKRGCAFRTTQTCWIL